MVFKISPLKTQRVHDVVPGLGSIFKLFCYSLHIYNFNSSNILKVWTGTESGSEVFKKFIEIYKSLSQK